MDASRAIEVSYSNVLNEHFRVPMARELEKNSICFGLLDDTANGIVRPTEVALGFEFQVRHETQFRASYIAVVAKLIFHFTEEYASSIHVGLRNEAIVIRVGHVSLHTQTKNLLAFVPIEKGHDGNSFHHTGCRVAQELAARLEGAVDPNIVFWGHEEITGLRRVMRGLFGNVVCPSLVRIVPETGKGLAEDGVERLLNSSAV
jgi:hypothetical protein